MRKLKFDRLAIKWSAGGGNWLGTRPITDQVLGSSAERVCCSALAGPSSCRFWIARVRSERTATLVSMSDKGALLLESIVGRKQSGSYQEAAQQAAVLLDGPFADSKAGFTDEVRTIAWIL
jgi:hypothetical protein